MRDNAGNPVPAKMPRIHDTLRRELAEGVYRIGEVLPSVDDLRKRFGVGEYAVRKALRRLRDEGFVTLRRHVGTVVADTTGQRWMGRIAFIAVRMSGSYFAQALEVRFAERFETAGYLTSTLYLDYPGDEEKDLTRLSRHLANGMSFAVCLCGERRVSDLLDRAGIPHIVLTFSDADFPAARAVVRANFRRCYDDLIRAMRARGARTLLEIDLERTIDRSFKNQLFEAGIQARRIMCRCDGGSLRHSGDAKSRGHGVVAEFFDDAHNRTHPPDVILFDDDYLAFGGIVAILEAGLRIPADIGVASFSNRGNEPVLGVSLARVENDPVAFADAVADYVLAQLAGRKAPPPRAELRFIPGESL